MALKTPREHIRLKIQALHQSGIRIKATKLKVDCNTVRLWERQGDGNGNGNDQKRSVGQTKIKTTKLAKNLELPLIQLQKI